MSSFEIVLIVVVILLIALAAGGAYAQKRRMKRNTGVFEDGLRSVNEDLAIAHAEDRGWERETLEAAAREAAPGEGELTLVRIVDRPGTDEDKAIFQVGEGDRRLTLGRRDGAWVRESLR